MFDIDFLKINEITSLELFEQEEKILLQSWSLTFKSKFSGGSIVDIRTSRDKGQLVTVQVGGREEEGSKREMRWWQKKKKRKVY